MGSKVMKAVEESKINLDVKSQRCGFLIQGHASEDGGSEYNMTLSRKRG